MSDREKPDKPGLWLDTNGKTYVACMKSGGLKVHDLDTGMGLSEEQMERDTPFRRCEWTGIDLTTAEFSALPNAAGCWCDEQGRIWLITGGGIEDRETSHTILLKELDTWKYEPSSGITVKMLHEWGPWTPCDFGSMNAESTGFDWYRPWTGWRRGWGTDDMKRQAADLYARVKEVRAMLPESYGLWKAAHGGYCVAFPNGDGATSLLMLSKGRVIDVTGESGPFTPVHLGMRCGHASTPNHPGMWVDAAGRLLFLSDDGRLWLIRDEDGIWMAVETEHNTGVLESSGPYDRYAYQIVSRPESATQPRSAHREHDRIVRLPTVQSFGRLERDKWLAVKMLEESAELMEACKQYVKACDPTDPSGIGRQFDDHANCLACYGVNVGGELGADRDRAKNGWLHHVRDQRRRNMLNELADVLQTFANLITAFDVSDEEIGQAMKACMERNKRKGRV